MAQRESRNKIQIRCTLEKHGGSEYIDISGLLKPNFNYPDNYLLLLRTVKLKYEILQNLYYLSKQGSLACERCRNVEDFIDQIKSLFNFTQGWKYLCPLFGGPLFGGPLFGGPLFGGSLFGGSLFGGPLFVGPLFGGSLFAGPLPLFGGPLFGGSLFGGPLFGGLLFAGPLFAATPPQTWTRY
ncbi:hypothetical protein K435DRAFT_794209 [Dendrothele bispora CBS 962.96]|uniref:Uncharacterized protein n=1 Tax=Dendrothele bispora (strain CBS 962.96) TaxID=1314807 RepID=A0A4S8MD90_DENBC|nr:hypothetical protein K435DRAFT_794209 [Dendrothele bispora CBS 962.96]